ncbi:uncharacterized protein LOC132203950 [Neocloeon triangulifer]|uniref:uncharacterized protein LOC132203950 n=1 Tax=Neocloeon triangulifer TaxID=2078957 RepID=UPI00286FAC0A|nr:uncharacterized protein LOC132203950 [Neocloeon triangulifer]XP_059488110.1 uncharacterized protein LOC132203950 [Neocloeon triangulifer]XP_059488111.1 uncharacterized protein LOC132203950 [Neocloeon triangulifer]
MFLNAVLGETEKENYNVKIKCAKDHDLCWSLALALHYMRLSVFCWLAAMTFDLYCCFRENASLVAALPTPPALRQSFARLLLFAWGAPSSPRWPPTSCRCAPRPPASPTPTAGSSTTCPWRPLSPSRPPPSSSPTSPSWCAPRPSLARPSASKLSSVSRPRCCAGDGCSCRCFSGWLPSWPWSAPSECSAASFTANCCWPCSAWPPVCRAW